MLQLFIVKVFGLWSDFGENAFYLNWCFSAWVACTFWRTKYTSNSVWLGFMGAYLFCHLLLSVRLRVKSQARRIWMPYFQKGKVLNFQGPHTWPTSTGNSFWLMLLMLPFLKFCSQLLYYMPNMFWNNEMSAYDTHALDLS